MNAIPSKAPGRFPRQHSVREPAGFTARMRRKLLRSGSTGRQRRATPSSGATTVALDDASAPRANNMSMPRVARTSHGFITSLAIARPDSCDVSSAVPQINSSVASPTPPGPNREATSRKHARYSDMPAHPGCGSRAQPASRNRRTHCMPRVEQRIDISNSAGHARSDSGQHSVRPVPRTAPTTAARRRRPDSRSTGRPSKSTLNRPYSQVTKKPRSMTWALAPPLGLEPRTLRLTAECSAS